MFQNYYPPKMQKLWKQIEFTTKHRMLSYKFYPNPENCSPSRMVWMVTFSKPDFCIPNISIGTMSMSM